MQTHPFAARKAAVNLKRQAFEYYNPICDVRVKTARGTVVRQAQLFQDYMFVFVVDRWRALKSTLGVSQLLMADADTPATVSQEVIDNLRAREENGIFVIGKSRFRDGQQLLVQEGPFAWESVIFDGQSSRDRVFVLLSILGTQRRVEMPEDNLVAA